MSGAETANGKAFERGMSYIQQLGKSFLGIDLGPWHASFLWLHWLTIGNGSQLAQTANEAHKNNDRVSSRGLGRQSHTKASGGWRTDGITNPQVSRSAQIQSGGWGMIFISLFGCKLTSVNPLNFWMLIGSQTLIQWPLPYNFLSSYSFIQVVWIPVILVLILLFIPPPPPPMALLKT